MFRKVFLILLVLLSASFSFGQGFVASGNKAVDARIQDQHTRSLDLKFSMASGIPTTLSKTAVIDDRTIELTTVVGFVDGTDIIIAASGDEFFVAVQLGSPVGSVITIDTPLDRAYASGSVVVPATTNMNVDGSSLRKIFQIGSAGSSTSLDITRIMGYMQDGNSMADDNFGSLAALANGCVFRVAHTNGSYTNLWNVKTNGDLALIGYDFSYPDHPPAGEYSARFRITYASQGKHGVTIRLAPGEVLEFIIQDNLTALDIFNIMAQGHVVE